MKTKGFTLVELLVVIAILAILATVSVVGYTSFIKSADESAMMQETHQIETIIDNALIVNDYVTVKVGETTYYITEGTDYFTVTATAITTGKGVDLTSDIGAELVAKLSFASETLTYTYSANATQVIADADGKK